MNANYHKATSVKTRWWTSSQYNITQRKVRVEFPANFRPAVTTWISCTMTHSFLAIKTEFAE